MSRFLFVAPLLVACAVSESIVNCDEGWFEADDADVCKFQCTDLQGNEHAIDPSTMSFDFIKEECTDVLFGSFLHPLECSTLADLVWPGECGCPVCGCATETIYKDDAGYHTLYVLTIKYCYASLCMTIVTDTATDTTALGYRYLRMARVDRPQDWSDLTCPPPTCDPSMNWASETFFSDECDRFCYCGWDGVEHCTEPGFADIATTTDTTLVSSFKDECEYDLQDCLDEPSRVFQRDSYCYDCYSLACDCGDYNVGDAWESTYTDSSDQQYCASCSCVDFIVPGWANETYVYCNDLSYGACDSTTGGTEEESISCHSEESVSYQVGALASEECGDSEMCGWLTGGNPTVYEWGCQENLFCEVYEATSACIRVDTSFSYTDCNGVEHTEEVEGALSCCNDADNCNHEDIDVASCTVNPEEVVSFFQQTAECSAFDIDCYGYSEFLSVEQPTCGEVRRFYAPQIQCFCNLYGSYYDRMSDARKASASAGLAELVGYFVEVEQGLGCTDALSCNLAAGGVFEGSWDGSDMAAGKAWLCAAISAFLFVLLMN